jgi:hypothetical protein
MKSTRKIFYNHRIAQSQEKWETEFLSKIDDANDLLYLAAVKSNGYSKTDDTYYTESNRDKIVRTLDDVVSNQYNQRHHKLFAELKNAALEILDKKIKKQSSSGPSTTVDSGISGTPNTSVPSDLKTEPSENKKDSPFFGQSEIGQFPKVQSPSFDPERDNFTEDAKTILNQLDDIEKISNENPDQFGREWLNFEKDINKQLDIAKSNNRINIKEISNIKVKLENLSNKWASLFYPGGFRRLKNGTMIPVDVADSTDSLMEQLRTNQNTEEVIKLRDVYQKAFLDKKSLQNEELKGYLAKLNIEITRRNGNNKFEGRVPYLIMSQFRR